MTDLPAEGVFGLDEAALIEAIETAQDAERLGVPLALEETLEYALAVGYFGAPPEVVEATHIVSDDD